MILGAGELAAEISADVCVVGSGPAGLTTALALARRGFRVVVLEGGGLEFSDDSQDVYRGTTVGHPYHPLDASRLRFFGGTSNHWGGWSRPLDAIDFEEKPYLPHAHWPIRRADLDPHLAEACDILDIDAAFDDRPMGGDITRLRFRFSRPPTRFAEKYHDEVRTSDKLLVVLDASVTGVTMAGNQATGFTITRMDGVSHRVAARKLVLACGGIENSRLLLHFNAQTGNALVRTPQTLGRYWMEHPHFRIGDVAYFSTPEEQQYFALTPERIRREEVLNCGLRVWVRNGEAASRFVRELYCDAPAFAQDWLGRNRRWRHFNCFAPLHAAWEQEPRADNRVALDPGAVDRFGIPQPVLHWTFSDLDKRTAMVSALAFGEHIAREHLGRLRIADWLRNADPFPEDDDAGGHHHMGGTRMAADPRRGVVDSDLRIWGQEHMYVAGSSVFPTGGHANPTLTIVQLSLRLADHLSGTLLG